MNRVRLRLDHKIWALMLVITLLAGLVMTVVGHQRVRSAAHDTTHLWANNLVNAAATAALDHVLLGELDRTEQVLRRVMATEGVRRIELRDSKGSTIITLTRQKASAQGAAPSEDEIVIGFGLERNLFLEYGSAPDGREVGSEGQAPLWVTRPLSDQFDAGEVGLLFNDEAIAAQQAEALRDQQLLGLGFTVLIAVLVYLLLNRSLRPISRLARHMRDVLPNGGAPWQEPARSREVQDIATAFNGLMERQRQHLDELTASRKLLSATLDGAPNGVLVVDSDWKLRVANRAARRLFKLTEAQLAQTEAIDIERLLPGASAWLSLEAENSRPSEGSGHPGGDPSGRRTAACTLDGRRFTAELHGSTIRVTHRPDHVILVRDVTDEEEVRRQAHLRTHRLNTVLALSNEGIVLFSAERQVVFANAQLCKLLGLAAQPENLTQMPMAAFEQDLVARSLPDRPYRPLAPGDEALDALTFAIQREGGGDGEHTLTRFWRRSGGDADEIVMFFIDITAAEAVARMKSEFLSSAAHELRTPLTSILGFSDLMLQHALPAAEQRELLQTIRDQSGLLVNIINEMLDLTRIESRRGQDFRPQACDVAQLCRVAMASVRPPGDTREVAVQHHHGPHRVWADPEKMHQVLVNLLSNAFKFSPGGGAIDLRTEVQPHRGKAMLYLCLRDQGVGMGKADLDHAFERFYRADKSGHIPGTGLGLSLVKQIIELSGSDIALESTLGQGTVVHVWLPLASATTAGPATPVQEATA